MRVSPPLVLALLAAGGCSSDDGPPLTDATSLNCPYPGNLPFRLPTSGYAKPVNETTVSTEKVAKDQAFDLLGNPIGLGVQAAADLDDTAVPTAGAISFDGSKARTTATQGLLSDPLPGEHVSLWYLDLPDWQSIGTTVTDDGGQYHAALPSFHAATGATIYSMLDADGSCAAHSIYLYPAGTKVVVVDIDGTLTTDDNQILMQTTNESYVPAMMGSAAALTQAWSHLNYPVIYLTARPHILQPESRAWLASQGFADGPLITEGGGKAADVYKTLWLQRLITNFGWNVVAAYGNASTDITAYNNVSIPKAQTFIVGPLAGSDGTTPIDNMDFSAHIASYVQAQPVQPASP